MKISYNWLKQFIKLPADPEETGHLLTDLGLEVEGITNFQSVKGGLTGVVTGDVISCEQHPNADRLKLCKIDVGNGQLLQIVCGAPNIEKGQIVPVATIGTNLYDDKGVPFEIKKGKIRGEASEGMVCSESELGLGKSHEGIMVLKNDLKPGTPVSQIFEVENDHVFEIGLTPNRADAMSHWGVARDLKAGYQQKDLSLELITPSVGSFHVDSRSFRIPVKVLEPTLAPRYCGVTVSGIEVKESPSWLKNRLKAIGINSKNNLVDISNYLLHELGQPLHFFDADKIAGGEIHVKTLAAGTKFVTLDEVERELHQEDLMICDTEKPLALAGIFGGLHSGVTKETTRIFIESAYFNPVSIRKTAKRHGLNTDASFRYERGIDPAITVYALKRAAILIMELAGGEITSDVEDHYSKKIEDFQVFLTFDKVNKLIGQNLPTETIKSILASLEIKVINMTESGMGLTIPSYRVDVQRETDVIEEILRIYGYNNIEFGTKLQASISPSTRFEDYKLQNIVAAQLVGQGFYETMANSLISPGYNKLSEQIKEEFNVNIINPLSQELSVMRQSLLFSGLEALNYNINRRQEDLKLFEFGKTYHNYEEGRVENKHLSLFVTGARNNERWNSPVARGNFFFMKGVISAILERLGLTTIKTGEPKQDIFAEGLSISIGKSRVAEFGVLKKHILKHFHIAQEVLYADLNWDLILEAAKKQKTTFTSIPKFPMVRRDFALLLSEDISYHQVEEIALQTEKKLLKEVSLFDVYQGNNLPEGKKSYAVSFMFQDEYKTMTDVQVDKIMKKLQQRFENELQAELR
ncbi:phenylalanine--tRNA ligase subunit beta [soil metagenome]